MERRPTISLLPCLVLAGILATATLAGLSHAQDLDEWGNDRSSRNYGAIDAEPHGPSSSAYDTPSPRPTVTPSPQQPRASSGLYPSLSGVIPTPEPSPGYPEADLEDGSAFPEGPTVSAPGSWGIDGQPDGTVRTGYVEGGQGASRPVASDLVVRGKAVAGGDGHTLMVGDQLVRLDAIHAPQADALCTNGISYSWRCGRASQRKLAELLSDQIVQCSGRIWSGDALVASCQRQDGVDIAASLVRQGLAIVNRDYFQDYAQEEAYAKNSSLGLWGGAFDRPWLD